MQVSLYTTSDDRRVVSKTLTAIAENISIVPKEQLDIITPRIRIAWNSNYLAANYMYLSEINRYYFISDMMLNTGHNIDLIGNIDVLKTYDAEIRTLQATIIRSESIGAPTMYPDEKLPIVPGRKIITSSLLPNTLHNVGVAKDQYVLVIKGGSTLTPNRKEGAEEDASES